MCKQNKYDRSNVFLKEIQGENINHNVHTAYHIKGPEVLVKGTNIRRVKSVM